MTKKYSEEFKKQMVQEYLKGTSYPKLSKEYQVAKSTLVGWVKKYSEECQSTKPQTLLWSSIFVTLMANKIGGLQFGIYRNCQISSRVFHTAVAALPLTKANRSDFE